MIENICYGHNYEGKDQTGATVKKTQWVKVGTLITYTKTDGTTGKMIKINPCTVLQGLDANGREITYSVFPSQQNQQQTQQPVRQQAPVQDAPIQPEDIPF